MEIKAQALHIQMLYMPVSTGFSFNCIPIQSYLITKHLSGPQGQLLEDYLVCSQDASRSLRGILAPLLRGIAVY